MEKIIEPVEVSTEPNCCSDVLGSLKSLPNGDETGFKFPPSSTFALFHLLFETTKELKSNRNAPITDVPVSNIPADTVLSSCLKELRLRVTQKHCCDYVVENAAYCFPILDSLMQLLLTKRNASALYTKYLLHVFINTLSSSSEEEAARRAIIVHKHISKQNIHAFFCNADGCFYETSALLYNMYRCQQIEDIALIESILLHDSEPNTSNEYTVFLVELVMAQEFAWIFYSQLGQKARLALQDSLRDKFMFDKQDPSVKLNNIPEECLRCLCNTFKTSINVIFQVAQENDLAAIREVARVLENLGHAASIEKFLPFLQNDKDLLVNAGVLLINVHRLGKGSNNMFTPLQKISHVQGDEDGGLQSPVTGFKADLVRLIGNLCWKNRKMQDLAREGELIPILLDSCNIDAKNPFIMQWAIFTLRVLCDCNQENQAIIAGLSKQGLTNSDALQDLGLTLHAGDDGKIGIMRLDVSK